MDLKSFAPPLEGGSEASVGDLAIFGVVTVSDRASAGAYSDLSGPAILQFFNEAIKSRCGSKKHTRKLVIKVVSEAICLYVTLTFMSTAVLRFCSCAIH